MEEKAKRGTPRVPIEERQNIHICIAVSKKMQDEIRNEAKKKGTNVSRFIINAVAEKLTTAKE